MPIWGHIIVLKETIMEKSLIYELLSIKYITKYRAELEKEEDDNLTKWYNAARLALEEKLDAEQMKLLKKYNFNYGMREEYIDFQVDIMVLNYGIKIGMELQKALDAIEN